MSRRRASAKVLQSVRHGNEQLCCSICGYRFIHPWMKLWVIKAHFEIWHGQEEVTLLTIRPNENPDVPEPITMGEAEDITRLLKQLHDVNEETKQVTIEARQALKDLTHGIRESQATVRTMIEKEVEAVAATFAGDAQRQLQRRVDEVVDGIAKRLSERLSL